MSWLQNGTALPEPPATEQNPDGTYRTRRYYTLSTEQRDQGGKVECAVNQPGVVHPVSGSAYLETLDPRGETEHMTGRSAFKQTQYSSQAIKIFKRKQ